MNSAWQGKTAAVTGGSKGIGRAVIGLFAEQGASVWYLSRTAASDHDLLSKKAEEAGGSLRWICTDMTDESSIEQALETVISTDGGIDVLVNNAGITRDGLIMRMKREAWDEVINVNLTGTFIACRTVTRSMMKARKGTIINISSVVGITGNGGQTNYAASKAGIIGFSKSLARELASRGIRVNVIAPGFVDTQMTGSLKEEQREALTAQIPLGRIGDPLEIALAVEYLASDAARYITGQVLAVDGGMTM
jgi:3-oxoacyl-[acyl-carrier protein] reductase